MDRRTGTRWAACSTGGPADRDTRRRAARTWRTTPSTSRPGRTAAADDRVLQGRRQWGSKHTDLVRLRIRRGTTSRPPAASCSTHAGGRSHAPTATMMRSNGAYSAAPNSPSAHSTRTPGRSAAVRHARARSTTSGSMSIVVDWPFSSDQFGQEGGLVAAGGRSPAPGRPGCTCACSSIVAMIPGADTELIGAPCSSRSSPAPQTWRKRSPATPPV